MQFRNPIELSRAIITALQYTSVSVLATSYNTLADVPANFTGRAFISGIYIDFINGFITVSSIFRLQLVGTGTVSIDTIDYLGAISTNVFSYSLPTDVGIKSFVAESIVGIRITSSTTASILYIG